MERPIDSIFERFLKFFGILDVFEQNLKTFKKGSLEEYLKKYTDDAVRKGVYRRYVSQAFDWQKTQQGHYYWQKISDNWVRISKQRVEYLNNGIQVRIGDTVTIPYGTFVCKKNTSRSNCGGCHFLEKKKIACYKHRLKCTSNTRFDGEDVIFVEKGGEV